jgi:hypothetical protein
LPNVDQDITNDIDDKASSKQQSSFNTPIVALFALYHNVTTEGWNLELDDGYHLSG